VGAPLPLDAPQASLARGCERTGGATLGFGLRWGPPPPLPQLRVFWTDKYQWNVAVVCAYDQRRAERRPGGQKGWLGGRRWALGIC